MRYGMPSASSPARTAAKCSAAAGLRNSSIRGAPSISGWSVGRFESSTRRALRSSVWRLSSDSSSRWCGEVGAQRLDVAGPVGRFAEAVQPQLDLAQSEGGVEAPAEDDDLDVEVRIVHTEGFDVDLVELAVSTALGLLVPEVGAGAPRLPRRRRAVLDEGPAHAGGELRPQRHVPPPRSVSSYISLATTSDASPMRRNTPMSSSIGVTTCRYPAGSTTPAKTSTNRRQRPDSGARMSRMPGLVVNSGTAAQATGAPCAPIREFSRDETVS